MIKGSGYYFNGRDYIAYYQGKQIGTYATASQAWKAIGCKQWRQESETSKTTIK